MLGQIFKRISTFNAFALSILEENPAMVDIIWTKTNVTWKHFNHIYIINVSPNYQKWSCYFDYFLPFCLAGSKFVNYSYIYIPAIDANFIKKITKKSTQNECLSLLNVSLDQNYFQFVVNFFKQNKCLPMGSPFTTY